MAMNQSLGAAQRSRLQVMAAPQAAPAGNYSRVEAKTVNSAPLQGTGYQMGNLGQSGLNDMRSLINQTQGNRDFATSTANAGAGSAFGNASSLGTWANNDRTTFDQSFKPVYESIADDAMNYDNASRRNAAAGTAIAGAQQQVSAAMTQNQEDMARRGIKPSSGTALLMQQNAALEGAKAAAGAGTLAARGVEDAGFARKMQAAGVGSQLSGNAMQAMNASNAGYGSAAGLSRAGLDASTSGADLLKTGYGIGLQGYGQQADSLGKAMSNEQQNADNYYQSWDVSQREQQMKNQANQFNTERSDKRKSDRSRGIGQIVGAGLMAMSTKKAKKKVSDNDNAKSLKGVQSLDYDNWEYKGAFGGGKHTGPYAEDAQKSLGEATAPNGKAIDLISMSGHHGAAIKELADRLDAVESNTSGGRKASKGGKK